jgi:dTDP-D-glucose 4,6-dehydratase
MSLNVLVLGGVGFIGRNFVEYLIKNNLVANVRVVDKVLPATAYLSASHKEIFGNPKVEFKQANLVNQGTCW